MKTRKVDQLRWNPEMKELERFQIEIPIEKPEDKNQKQKAKKEIKSVETDERNR